MAFCEQKAFSLSSRDPLAAPDFNSPFRCHFPRFYCDALHTFLRPLPPSSIQNQKSKIKNFSSYPSYPRNQRFKPLPLPLQFKIQNPKSSSSSLCVFAPFARGNLLFLFNPKSKIQNPKFHLFSCLFSHHPSYPSYQRFKPLTLLSSSLASFSCVLLAFHSNFPLTF